MTGKPEIKAFFDEPTHTVSYLVWDPATKEAAVVDPVLNFDQDSGEANVSACDAILKTVGELGLKVVRVLETHAHADHVTSAGRLCELTGAVAANALASVASHARAGNVRWPCASVFAASGIAGAFAGSALGRQVDGQALLAAFAVLMVVVAVLMLRRKDSGEDRVVRLNRGNAPALVGTGLVVGALSGFFGIGGGFLIVPGLVFATGMPMLQAIGTSLVAVTAFGLTTAGTYAAAGLVDWPLAALFVGGGVLGSLFGGRAAGHLAQRRGALTRVFAGLIAVVAGYMLARSLGLIG